jgi:hypothetical protein
MPNPLVSRQDLTDYLGRDVTADEGALAAVDAASDMVRTLTEQTLNEVVGDQITVDGTGTDAIVLPQLPVNNVGTVELIGNDGGTTALQDYALNGHGVLLRTRGSATEDFPTSIGWPVGRQNVQITYDHGYGTADMPRDLRRVALSVASRLIVQGVALFETQGQQTVRYGVNSTDFTAGEKLILGKYRQIG